MTSRKSKVLGMLLALAGLGAVACIDLSAPKDKPASISLLQLPAFFVVRGDVMRDSLGAAVKPAVIAYDATGAVMENVTPEFFVIDTNAVAHFDASGFLAGDRLGTFRVVGQIGNLQTPVTLVNVTVAPTKLVRTALPSDTLKSPVGPDSVSSLGFLPLSASIKGAGDTAVAGGFVRYEITYAPASKPGSPAVYLSDDAGNPSVVDTADASGTVSRRLTVNSRFLADAAVLSGQKAESVVVVARARYRGADLQGSPARFVIRLQITFPLK